MTNANSVLKRDDTNHNINADFKFTPIPDCVSIEDATKTLVNLARNIQESHTEKSGQRPKSELELIFKIRKQGIMAVLNLIEAYIDQVPENVD